MIRQIKRPDPPPQLKETKQGCTHEAVKEALIEDLHGKCYLCERKQPITEVEHFRPRAEFPELRDDWDNLFLACPHSCNQRRGAWPEGGLIHPSIADIEARLHQVATQPDNNTLMDVDFRPVERGDLEAANTARVLRHIHDEGRHGKALRSDLTARVMLFLNRYLDWSMSQGASKRAHLSAMRGLLKDGAAFSGVLRSWARARFEPLPEFLVALGLSG